MEENIQEAVFALAEDCRYLAAFDKAKAASNANDLFGLDYIYTKNAENETKNNPISVLDVHNPNDDSREYYLMKRVKEITDVISKSNGDAECAALWTLGSNFLGISTYYMRIGSNDIIIKLEGTMHNLPIFEQCAVIHEVDLFKSWVPLCDESILIEKIGKAELVAYMSFNVMGFSRDTLLHAYAADCTLECGKIIIVGKSIDSYSNSSGEVRIPWKPVGWFHQRLVIKEFHLVMDIVSPTSAKTHIIAHLDFNAPIPQTIVNYLVTKVAGLFLYFFQRQVAAVQNDSGSAHASRIRSNVDFYAGWVLPKIRSLCDLRGWEYPTVTCLST